MADETPTINPMSPSWAADTQSIIRALMQGARPSTDGYQGVSGDLNPWLKALEQQTAPEAPSFDGYGGYSPQTTPTRTQQLHADQAKGKTPDIDAPIKGAPLQQYPIADILKLQNFVLNPQVELAKQRVMQALMQRAHTTLPAATAAPVTTAKA